MRGFKLEERFFRKLFTYVIFVLMIATVIVTVYAFIMKGFSGTAYELIWAWPLSYFAFLLFLYIIRQSVRKDHLILIFMMLISFSERYVAYPFFIACTRNDYVGIRHYSMDDSIIAKGVGIGVSELLGFTIFFVFYEYIKRIKTENCLQRVSLKLIGEKSLYYIYAIFAFAVWLMIGRKYHVVQFLRAKYRFTDVTSNVYLVLVRYIITCGITILILIGLSYCKKYYDLKRKRKYFILALVLSMIQICVITGESRGTQIGVAFLMIIMLVSDYPDKIMEIIIPIGAGLVVVVASITLLRTNTTSLQMTDINSICQKLQIYIGGVDSLAQAVDLFSKKVSVSLNNYLFDFFRSIFPINLFLKGDGFTINQMYNLTLYNGAYKNGHIVFGASYWTIMFGFIGAPLNLCVSYWLAAKICELFTIAKSYEGKYMAGFCLLRVQAAMFSNLPTILGSVTQFIGTFGLVVLAASLNRLVREKIKLRC